MAFLSRWILLLLATMSALGVASAAAAQGTEGLLPGPITAARLGVYGDMLNLSLAQRHALDGLHAAYRDEFQRLRETDIEPFVRLTVGSATQTRSFWVTQRDLMQRIAVIDSRLFDALTTILTEEQIGVRLPRVKRMRQRERLLGPDSHWSTRPPLDLSAAVMELALPPEQMLAVEPILASYEPALTERLQDYIDQSFGLLMREFDAYAQQGLSEADLLDPAKAKEVMEIFTSVVDGEAARSFARVQAIDDLNRTTLHALRDGLPLEAGQWLRGRLLQACYPRVAEAAGDLSPFADALDRDNLTDDQRRTLEIEDVRFVREVAARVDLVTARIDAHRAKFEPLGITYDWDEEDRGRHAIERDTMALRDEVAAIRIAAAQQIAAITGAADQAPADDDLPGALAMGFDLRTNQVVERAIVVSLLLPEITAREVADYAALLRLDAPHQRQLHAAWKRYVGRCDSFHTKQASALKDAIAQFQRRYVGFNTDNVERFERTQAAAAMELRAMDESFFADVQESLQLRIGDDGLRRIRLARQRQEWNPGLFGGLRAYIRAPGGAMESLLDLSTLLHRIPQIDAGEPTLDRILDQYEQDVAPLLKTRYNIILATQQAEIRISMICAAKLTDGALTRDEVLALNRDLGVDKIQADAQAVNGQIVELNKRTLALLVAALPVDRGENLRSTYERLCWPRIYRDASFAGQWLTRALQLRDLTPIQRAEIEDIATAFRPAYDELCAQMIASVEKPDSPTFRWILRTEEEQSASSDREARRQRLAFDRYELNVRAWQRLRGILTPVQAKSIRLRTTPPPEPGEYDDYGVT